MTLKNVICMVVGVIGAAISELFGGGVGAGASIKPEKS